MRGRKGGWPTLKDIRDAHWDLLCELPATRIDPGEGDSTCWACGYGMSGFRPQRAHIAPRCGGGSLEPSNFFLLCEACHRDQPDGAPLEQQIEWLRTREHWRVDAERKVKEYVAAAQAEADRLGVDLEEWADSLGPLSLARRRFAYDAGQVTACAKNYWPNVLAAVARGVRDWSDARGNPLAMLGYVIGCVSWADFALRENVAKRGRDVDVARASIARSFGICCTENHCATEDAFEIAVVA